MVGWVVEQSGEGALMSEPHWLDFFSPGQALTWTNLPWCVAVRFDDPRSLPATADLRCNLAVLHLCIREVKPIYLDRLARGVMPQAWKLSQPRSLSRAFVYEFRQRCYPNAIRLNLAVRAKNVFLDLSYEGRFLGSIALDKLSSSENTDWQELRNCPVGRFFVRPLPGRFFLETLDASVPTELCCEPSLGRDKPTSPWRSLSLGSSERPTVTSAAKHRKKVPGGAWQAEVSNEPAGDPIWIFSDNSGTESAHSSVTPVIDSELEGSDTDDENWEERAETDFRPVEDKNLDEATREHLEAYRKCCVNEGRAPLEELIPLQELPFRMPWALLRVDLKKLKTVYEPYCTQLLN